MKDRIGIAAFLSSALVCCGLAGCAPTPVKPSPDADQHEHVAHIDYIPARPRPDNAVPAYPRDLLDLRLPPELVAVRLDIDAQGNVVDVVSVDPFASQDQRRFLAAVKQTCLRWTFSPLIQLDLDAGPTKVVENGVTVDYRGLPKPLPSQFDYQFVFSQQDGLPLVEASASKP
jgi:hypothetical protein